MKKIIITLAAIAAAFTLASCDKEVVTPENNPAAGTKTVIKASIENTLTKTALDESYNVVWSVGDTFKAISPVTYCIFNLANNDDAGKTSATFECSGQIEDDDYRAWYATEGTTWPDVQTYEAGKITNSPMTAVFSVDGCEADNIQFKNMGGLLRLTISGSADIKSITISADQAMAGEFSCDEPGMAATIMGSKKSITLGCGDGVNLTSSGVEFFIAMPANTYTGVSIKLIDTDDNVCTKTFKGTDGLVIERSVITPASFTASDFKSYNIGDLVSMDGHEGIVVDLGGTLGKVIVATMNVGATCVNKDGCLGYKMTYDEACAAWSGWRLPTVDELTAFCDPVYPAFGDTYGAVGCNGAVMWNIDGVDGIDLYLPLNDYDEYANPSDKYWTGTPGSDGTYYYFAPAIDWENGYSPFEPEYIQKEEAAKDSEFLVRLFHNLP